MRNRRLVPFAAVLASLLLACSSVMNLRTFAGQTPQRSIAVVSLAINDFNGALQGWNSTRTSDLMSSRAAQMVQIAEAHFARRWNVVPAAAFSASPAYQQIPHGDFEVAMPKFGSFVMPVFGSSRGQLVGCEIDPGQAQMLAQATGAEYLAIVYSEWGVVTGRMVPTSKALTKTVVGIYDAAGIRVAAQRVDDRGERTLGALGHVVVDENSIDEWVGAYDRSIARMLGE